MKGLQSMLLSVRLALTRFGWTNGIAVLLCAVGVTVWLWGIPYLHAQVEARQRALSRAKQAVLAPDAPAAVARQSEAEERLANFYDALGEKRYAEQQVKTLFAVAAKTGLNLHQAEYKLAFDKNGRYHAYQISLPVKGAYGAIRQFCEQVLLTIPFASLDEISFKREAIASPNLEAKLRFTLYLADPSVSQKMAAGTEDVQP